MNRLVRIAIPLALFIGTPLVFRAGFAAGWKVPDHEHWTVPQCEKYWHDRGKDLWVETAANPTGHEPSEEERNPTVNLVKSNASSSPIGQQPAGSIVTVVLEPVGTTRQVPLKDIRAKPQLDDVHRHYSRSGVTLYQSLKKFPEDLNGYESWLFDRSTESYQLWVSEPVYEGGSVGVVINGSTTSLLREYADVLLGAALAAASALALGLGRGKRNSTT